MEKPSAATTTPNAHHHHHQLVADFDHGRSNAEPVIHLAEHPLNALTIHVCASRAKQRRARSRPHGRSASTRDCRELCTDVDVYAWISGCGIRMRGLGNGCNVSTDTHLGFVLVAVSRRFRNACVVRQWSFIIAMGDSWTKGLGKHARMKE